MPLLPDCSDPLQQVAAHLGRVSVPGSPHALAHGILLDAGIRHHQAGLCAAYRHERRDVSEVGAGSRMMRRPS